LYVPKKSGMKQNLGKVLTIGLPVAIGVAGILVYATR
jgi:hypothetical protein